MEKFATFLLEKRRVMLVIFLFLTVISGFLIPHVKVNTDMTYYLPADSMTREALDVMEREFGELENRTAYVMFEGTTESRQTEIYNLLWDMEDVYEVTFVADSPDHVQGDFVLYHVLLVEGLSEEQEIRFADQLFDIFSEEDIELTGVGLDMMPDMMLIIVPTTIILIIILFLMCHSWFEPIIFFINIGIALIINTGTNVIFPSISDITQMIAGLLQVVLSMDYAIIFLNRYRQEKEHTGDDHYLAMKNTIINSFSTISGISFTTIVGMLMLAFMSFRIGADIGFVIAKGVFISLLSVFAVMPALILMFDKLIDKTAKPALKFNLIKMGGFAYKVRFGMLFFFIVLFAGAFTLQQNVVITYSEDGFDPVHNVFDFDNTMMVMYETGADVSGIVNKLEQVEDVVEVLTYETTLGLSLNATEMADVLEMDPLMVALIYHNKFMEVPTVVLGDFLTFLSEDLPELGMIDNGLDEADLAGLASLPLMLEPHMFAMTFNADELAQLLNMEVAMTEQMLIMYNLTRELEVEGTLTLPEFMSFVLTDMAQHSAFEAAFDEDMLADLEEAYAEMVDGRNRLVGENFSLMVVSTTFPIESEETFLFIDDLILTLDEELTSEFHMLGASIMPHEMAQSFPTEFSFISILTVFAFFVVGAISFRSIAVSAILAIVIQAAVYITTGVISFQEAGIMYLPLIIAQLLLKSRVIDYGILYTANYIEARKECEVKEAIGVALNRSIEAILTSGLIIVLITFVVGLIFIPVNFAIAEIMLVIALGCFIGLMISIFILPSLIAVFDRFVYKAKSKAH